jgi:hypothetical protein
MMTESFLPRMILGQARRKSIFIFGINDGIKLMA